MTTHSTGGSGVKPEDIAPSLKGIKYVIFPDSRYVLDEYAYRRTPTQEITIIAANNPIHQLSHTVLLKYGTC